MRHFALRNACRLALGCILTLSLATPSMGRDWSPANSRLKIEAELEAFDGKTVSLRLAGGGDAVFNVSIEKLSAEDQAYLKKNYPNGKEREKKPEGSPAKEGSDKPEPESAKVEKPSAANAKGKKPAAASPRVARRVAAKVGTARSGDFEVEAVSLTVTKPSGASAGLVPGTHVTLFVSSVSKTLLRVDAEKTKIVCADDRANNLSKPLPGSEASTDEGPLTLDVAPDGKSGTIVIDFPRAPTTKATRIRLKGELHLVCGSDEDPELVTVPLALIVSLGL